jgi:hypothetical protein
VWQWHLELRHAQFKLKHTIESTHHVSVPQEINVRDARVSQVGACAGISCAGARAVTYERLRASQPATTPTRWDHGRLVLAVASRLLEIVHSVAPHVVCCNELGHL